MASGIGAVILGNPSNLTGGVADFFTLSGILVKSFPANGDVTLPLLEAAGNLQAPMAMPALAVAGQGIAGTVAAANASLPALAAAATLLPGTIGTGALLLPAATLDATTGTAGDAVLPPLAVAGTALAGNVLAGAPQLPALAADALLWQEGKGAGSVALQAFAVTASATLSGVAVADVILPAPAVLAQAAAGAVLEATLSVPAFVLDARTAQDATGTAQIVLPLFVTGADGIAPQAVQTLPRPAVTGVVVNSRTHAVTTYQGIAANSACAFGGMLLLATADGIVALAGDTDMGNPIAASVTSGVSDLGDDHFKRVLAGYVGYRADGDLQLTLITDDHHTYDYRLQPRRAGDQHASRVKFGRGVDGRYWQWTLTNRRGADFALDRITLALQALSKRV